MTIAAKLDISNALRRLSFSPSSFAHGIGAGISVLALMAVWMTLRADDTLTRQQADMPSKSAVIERIAAKTPEPAAPTAEEKAAEEAAANPNALPPAPLQGLYETTPYGQLPVANLKTGVTPFDAYRKTVTPVPGRPSVAILFLSAGLSESLTTGIIDDLPENVALAVSAYAPAPGVWINRIRAAGHEAWMTLPLQNDTYPDPDPGPYTILSNVSAEQNQDRLMRVMASGAGFAGLISLDDHNITTENPGIIPVMQQIFGRGLGFIDGRPDRPFFAGELAKAQSYPHADTDLTIGEDLTVDGVKAQLAQLERTALGRGQALAYAYPTPANIRAVAEWAATLEQRGLQLVPPSTLAAP